MADEATADIPRRRDLHVEQAPSHAPAKPLVDFGSADEHTDAYVRTLRLNLGKLHPRLGSVTVRYESRPDPQTVAERELTPEERARYGPGGDE